MEPIQSRSFKILQKMTEGFEEGKGFAFELPTQHTRSKIYSFHFQNWKHSNKLQNRVNDSNLSNRFNSLPFLTNGRLVEVVVEVLDLSLGEINQRAPRVLWFQILHLFTRLRFKNNGWQRRGNNSNRLVDNQLANHRLVKRALLHLHLRGRFRHQDKGTTHHNSTNSHHRNNSPNCFNGRRVLQAQARALER